MDIQQEILIADKRLSRSTLRLRRFGTLSAPIAVVNLELANHLHINTRLSVLRSIMMERTGRAAA